MKRKRVIHQYKSLHQQAIERNQPFIDIQLLSECAYYPRVPAFGRPPKCRSCSFTHPNLSCRYGHILIDTRIGGCELCHIYGKRVYKIHERKFCASCLKQIVARIKQLRIEHQEGG